MDPMDVQILRLLWEDGRMPIYRIAEKLGLSGAAIDKRINAMKRRGEIVGFTILLNPDNLLNSVVISLRTRKKRESVLESIEKIRGTMHFIACLGGRYYGELWYADDIELEEKVLLFNELTDAYSLKKYHHRKLKDIKIDRTDWRILLAMRDDSRIPFTKLSRKIGLSAKSISKRWDRLTGDEVVKAYPIINRPSTRDIFWFSLFIEVDNLSVENEIKKIENLWRTSLFLEPLMVYGVFYARAVRDIDRTMERVICMKGVSRVQYEIIINEKFFLDYLNYVSYKMGFRED